MKIAEVTRFLDQHAPPSHQESYDNAGLIVGSYDTEVQGILIALDVTEEVVEEAIAQKLNLIVAHHPIVFKGLKRFNGNNYVERTVIKAIQHNIAIYAAHTNLDAVLKQGVNTKIGEKLGLQNLRILSPQKGALSKLVVFVPESHATPVREALFAAGAGHIGNYDSCSFNSPGTGTFKGNESSTPYLGKPGELEEAQEIKIETIVPQHLQGKVLKAMLKAHPYEEVAYDLYQLENSNPLVGSGMVGELPEATDALDFLRKVKDTFQCGCIRHTSPGERKIKKVAFCGGAGSFLLGKAKSVGADLFITGDFKYHEFFDAEEALIIADIGHYESEQYTKELFYELLTGKFANFAVCLTKVNTNPINYL